MANQITHIVLTEKISNKIFGIFDREAFIIGTVFPDIRYLKVIDRDKTHFKGLSLKDVLAEKNSFTAGLKYHSLVDEVRERYMIEKGIYTLIPTSKFITQALKVYEDEVLYPTVSTWAQITAYLDTVLIDEKELVKDINKIKMWHSLMSEYFKSNPTDNSRRIFILNIGFSEEISTEINKTIDQMRKVPKVREIILNLYKDWDSILTRK